MMKWKNAELTKNYSKLLDSQQENSQLINYKIYELNSKISALQVLAQKDKQKDNQTVTNFIWPYLHQFSIDSHGLNGYGKPLKRPFDQYQSRLEAINNGRDIRQINW